MRSLTDFTSNETLVICNVSTYALCIRNSLANTDQTYRQIIKSIAKPIIIPKTLL